MRTSLPLLVALASLGGCLDIGSGSGGCSSPTAIEFAIPRVEGAYLATDPDEAWDTLVLQQNTTDGDHWINLTASDSPVARTPITPAGQWPSLSLLRVEPNATVGDLELSWWAQVKGNNCSSGKGGSMTWSLMEPRDGASAAPGQGVHVYTAGFWENGTLFYTNIEAIHDDPEWPRAGWYEWENAEPLPVYVYDKHHSEQPAYWKSPSSQAPATGSPVDSMVQGALSDAEAEYGIGFFPTIPGFNEALKDLSVNTVRVARLTPEQAYTRPGNEAHPLYGDALVFYIKVVDVVDLPCPAATGPATKCNVPLYPL